MNDHWFWNVFLGKEGNLKYNIIIKEKNILVKNAVYITLRGWDLYAKIDEKRQ